MATLNNPDVPSEHSEIKSVPQWRYQRFQYDSSKINGDEYRKRLLAQGWCELESSKEIEEHAWPLDYDRFNPHRSITIESFTLKRQEQVTTAASERPDTTMEADKNASAAQLEGSDGK